MQLLGSAALPDGIRLPPPSVATTPAAALRMPPSTLTLPPSSPVRHPRPTRNAEIVWFLETGRSSFEDLTVSDHWVKNGENVFSFARIGHGFIADGRAPWRAHRWSPALAELSRHRPRHKAASDQTSSDQVGQIPNEPPAPAPQAPSIDITVTAKRIVEPRASVASNVGASSYALTNQSIENLPGGDNASLSNVLLQAPGVAQDNMANGAIHIRNEHLAAQYRINGVMLPDGVSFFGEGISPRFIQSMNLITGTLPAEYGLRTAGVVDITTKSDVYQNGGSIGIYGGSYWTMQPSIDYGGNADGYNYFVSGDFMHNDHGINSPTPNYDAVHDETNQEHGFGYIEKQIDPSSKVSAIVGSFAGRFQVPNNPGQPVTNTVNGSAAFDSNALNENQNESANFGVLSYLHTEENWDIQVSPFTKYSTLYYTPDTFGDLAFGGVGEYALRHDFTNGLQADGSYKLNGHAHAARRHAGQRGADLGRYDIPGRMYRGAMPQRWRPRSAIRRSPSSTIRPRPVGLTAPICKTNGRSSRPSRSTTVDASTR